MKSKIRFTIAFLFVAIVISHAQSSFKAEMTDVQNGKTKVYYVQSNGEKYRYDFEEEGRKGIVIVTPAEKKTAILMPDKKYVLYTETSSSWSRANDPVQSALTLKARATEKKTGVEKMAGFNCDKSELYIDNDKIFTVWFSQKLNFPLRIENNMRDNTYMQVSAIELREIDPSVFVVPDHYTEVDERMRIKIPEPPAPKQWNNIEVSLPVNKQFKRGDRIKFEVPESGNYVVNLKNNTASPAKIIRTSFRDGEELPDMVQGPVKYRTERLYANETSKNTYVWQAGDTKEFKIYEGKLNINIQERNR